MSLEKIANRQALTKDDIITAANELVDLEKQAADADAYGRQLAHEYVEKLAADSEEEKEEEEEGEEKEDEKKEKKMEKKSADAELLAAVEALKTLGVIKA